jgi:hypothetical protein
VNPVDLLADLQDFIHSHRPHGPLTADATQPAWNGYLLTVACPTNAGKDAHARVKRVDQLDATEIRTWSAHEWISVRRATADEGRQ